jgi:hypothetical protein
MNLIWFCLSIFSDLVLSDWADNPKDSKLKTTAGSRNKNEYFFILKDIFDRLCTWVKRDVLQI